MNFSREQQTGELAELAVRTIFTQWGWLVGRDFLDAGYDLSVEPDRDRFHGARFLVQVKGTLQNGKRGLRAKVSKDRLRLYAENSIPVFIIRSMPGGKLYWVHAQEWAKTNRKRLLGDGESGVKFNPAHDLNDPEHFANYLLEIFRPLVQRPNAISNLISDREAYLSSLDERLEVRIEADRKSEVITCYGRSSGEFGQIHFQPASDSKNLGKLRDLIEFGLPDTIEAEDFRLTGSKLYEELGLTNSHRGQLVISPANSIAGSVRLLAGPNPSPLAPCLTIDAIQSVGSRGISVSNRHAKSLIDLAMRIWDDGSNFRMEVNLGVRHGMLSSVPIKDIADLDNYLIWSEAALAAGGLSIEFGFRGRSRLPPLDDQARNSLNFLRYLSLVGKLHKVAYFFDSPLVIEDKIEFSEHDEFMIDLAYRLLKGERCKANDFSAEIESIHDLKISDEMIYLVTTNIQPTVGDLVLGNIPIAVELHKFTIEEKANKKTLIGQREAQAWIVYDDQGESDVLMTLKSGS